MTKIAQLPDTPAPGRYAVIGYVGRKSDELHRWRRRRDAERVARLVIKEGYSTTFSARFTKIEVVDRFNRRVLLTVSAPQKRYGE